MQEKPNALSVLFVVIVLQAARAVTQAVYFGGKSEYAYMWGGLLALALVAFPLVVVWEWRLKRKPGYMSAQAIELSRFTHQGLLSYCVLVAIAVFAATLYWASLYLYRSAPQIPEWYRNGLYIGGTVVIAVTGFIIADALRAFQRLRREGFAIGSVRSH